MYILADKFVGNINDSKYSYLRGNEFYYTNDGVNYKKMQIDKEHIFNGTLNKFYTYVNIYPWIREDILIKYEDIIDKDNNRLYLEIHINNSNELTHIYTITKDLVDSNKCIESNEFISPIKSSKKEKIKVFSSSLGYAIGSNEDIFEDSQLYYMINICFPDMFYREDIGQYVFKNATVFEYKSKEKIINSIEDFILLKNN